MTKNELKQLIKEVLAEQNALTTLQISTVGGGTTLLLYRGDAKGSERSSDKHYKTPTQFRDLIASLNTTGGMTTDEAIKNILRKLTPEQLKQLAREKIVVSDRVSEFLSEEVSTKDYEILKDPVNDIAKKIKTIISNNPLYKNVSVNYLTTDSEDKVGLAVLRGGKAAVDAKLSDGNGSVFVSIDSPTRIRVTVKKNSGSGITHKFTNVDDVIAFLKNVSSLNEDGKMNEVKGFVLHWNTPEADYMRRKSVMKPKMHSIFKKMMGTQTMKYDDLVKAFPNSKSIVLKDLPSIPRGGDLDYFTVDEEGDIVPIQQADISSGLD